MPCLDPLWEGPEHRPGGPAKRPASLIPSSCLALLPLPDDSIPSASNWQSQRLCLVYSHPFASAYHMPHTHTSTAPRMPQFVSGVFCILRSAAPSPQRRPVYLFLPVPCPAPPRSFPLPTIGLPAQPVPFCFFKSKTSTHSLGAAPGGAVLPLPSPSPLSLQRSTVPAQPAIHNTLLSPFVLRTQDPLAPMPLSIRYTAHVSLLYYTPFISVFVCWRPARLPSASVLCCM